MFESRGRFNRCSLSRCYTRITSSGPASSSSASRASETWKGIVAKRRDGAYGERWYKIRNPRYMRDR